MVPITPSGKEVLFTRDEIIVSKTDLKGRITYANRVFQRVSGFTEAELIGKPHNMIRHPDMPRCVFQLLWDTVQSGTELFAYVVNLARNGDHYWVLAHVTPTFDNSGNIIGYHSNRRVPERDAIAKIEPLYKALLAEEAAHADRKEAIAASTAMLTSSLASLGMEYDEFAFSL
ncbi:MAG: PAS domain-containing protein [Planctomycetota bacterium]